MPDLVRELLVKKEWIEWGESSSEQTANKRGCTFIVKENGGGRKGIK
jgi:hypothetical protein